MAERAAWTSLLVALLVLGLKALAYRLTGSVALLSDALESTVNVVAASWPFSPSASPQGPRMPPTPSATPRPSTSPPS